MSISIRPFQPSTDTLEPFDCGKADLNGFLCETAYPERFQMQKDVRPILH